MALFGGVTLPGAPDLDNVRRIDLLPVRSVMEMERYGIAVDVDHLAGVSRTLASEMEELRYEICSFIPPEKLDEFVARANLDEEDGAGYLPMNVESTHQLVKLLFEVLKVGRGKQLKLTKSGDRVSTGRRQMEQLRLEHPVIGKVLAYRERAKLKGTYADKLPRMARTHPGGVCCPVCGLSHKADTKRVHTRILATRTSTGRYASKDPNLQNIPARSSHGRAIRAGFVASPGTELVSVDFSQVELRLLAYLAGVEKMAQAFRDGRDVHTETAMMAFGLPEDKIDKLIHRAPSKNVNFAVVYGETEQGLYEQLVSDNYGKANIPVPEWLTLEWCREFLAKWFRIYPEVREYMEQQQYRACRYGMVWDWAGRIRRVPEVRSVHKRVVAAGLRQAGNHPIQGGAGEMLKLAAAEVQYRVETEIRPAGVWCWPLVPVHDELVLEVEEGWGEVVRAMVEQVFEGVLADKQTGESYCSVPILAEGKVMQRWSK